MFLSFPTIIFTEKLTMRYITFVFLFFLVVSCSSTSSKIVGKWKLEEIDYAAYFLDVSEEVKILLENQMKEEFERLKNKTYFEFKEEYKLILEAPNYEGKQTFTEGNWKMNSSEDSLFFELEDLENYKIERLDELEMVLSTSDTPKRSLRFSKVK